MSSPTGERLARLLALVPWLRAHDGVTIHEAAQHFGVSDDQLTTDLWQLVVCGLPGYGPDQLVDIQFWDDDRIHVLDPIALEKPLRLSGEESAALLVALRVLAQVPGSHDREALRSAMAKLEAGIQAREAPIHVDVGPASTELTDAIDEAIAARKALEIDYAPGDRDQVTHRLVEPVHSYVVDGRVYVEAYCHLAGDVRTFRLDRITAARAGGEATVITAEGWQQPVDHVPARPTGAQSARIAVNPEAAWVWDSDPVVADGLQWAERGWPTGTVDYASLGWLTRYVLGRAGHVVVLEPQEARTEIARQAKAKLHAMRDAAPGDG